MPTIDELLTQLRGMQGAQGPGGPAGALGQPPMAQTAIGRVPPGGFNQDPGAMNNYLSQLTSINGGGLQAPGSPPMQFGGGLTGGPSVQPSAPMQPPGGNMSPDALRYAMSQAQAAGINLPPELASQVAAGTMTPEGAFNRGMMNRPQFAGQVRGMLGGGEQPGGPSVQPMQPFGGSGGVVSQPPSSSGTPWAPPSAGGPAIGGQPPKAITGGGLMAPPSQPSAPMRSIVGNEPVQGGNGMSIQQPLPQPNKQIAVDSIGGPRQPQPPVMRNIVPDRDQMQQPPQQPGMQAAIPNQGAQAAWQRRQGVRDRMQALVSRRGGRGRGVGGPVA